MISWFTRDEDSQRKCSMQNWQEKSEARDIHISSMLECGYRATSMKGSSKTSTGENCSWILYKRGRKNKLRFNRSGNWAKIKTELSRVWIQKTTLFCKHSLNPKEFWDDVEGEWVSSKASATTMKDLMGQWNKNTTDATSIAKKQTNNWWSLEQQYKENNRNCER